MSKVVKWFLLVQLIDLLTTLIGIIYFGTYEVNFFIIRFGLSRVIAFKIIAMLLVATGLMTRIKDKAGSFGIKSAIFLTVLSSLAPIWNTFVIVLTIITGKGVI